ncbi:MAG: phosphatase PAP2 family protein [Helcococcus sp.]|nr:phosphatase PAP2 family protein [Helcococcus sp.]
MIKNKDKIMYLLLIYAIIGMMIGSFYDLSLNHKLYANGDLFPNFFKITGEIPMIILFSISSLNYLQYNKDLNHIFKTILFVSCIAFPAVSSTTILAYFGITNIYYSAAIFILYMIVILTIIKTTKPFINENTLKYCLFIIYSIIAVVIIFNLMKNIWGRQRFFSIYYEQNYSLFTNWWHINGFPESDAFRSFPSGHTASAATSLVLLYLSDIINIKNKFVKSLTIIFPIVFTISTQFARIMDGAHYLTDVSMGLIIAIVVILYMKNKILQKIKITNI